jgi:signal transduction histidine kinase
MGPGLPDEVLRRLYEAFFSTKVEGMGIGLSLCRSIVESHRGRIKAQNLYNGSSVTGCRFAFTLPVETTARHDDTAQPHHANERDDDAAPGAAGQPAVRTIP